MAKSRIPHPPPRKPHNEREIENEKSLALADIYLEQGRLVEAVDFLVKAEANDRIEALKSDAVADGDAFLLKAIADATRNDPGADAWRALAEAAETHGKALYAEMARRHARASEEE